MKDEKYNRSGYSADGRSRSNVRKNNIESTQFNYKVDKEYSGIDPYNTQNISFHREMSSSKVNNRNDSFHQGKHRRRSHEENDRQDKKQRLK